MSRERWGRDVFGWQERLLAALLAAAVLLGAMSLVLPRVPAWAALRDPGQPWVVLLDVRAEGSVHTWFNVALLVAAAGTACLAAVVHRISRATSWPWWVVAVVLAALSVDDMLSLHESLEVVGDRWAGGEAAPHFAWVVPGAAVGAAFVLVLVLAARHLPRASRTALVGGLSLLLVAALALETVGGQVIAVVGDGAAYIVVSHVEEVLESFGACLMAYGVLVGLRWQTDGAGLDLRPALR